MKVEVVVVDSWNGERLAFMVGFQVIDVNGWEIPDRVKRLATKAERRSLLHKDNFHIRMFYDKLKRGEL